MASLSSDSSAALSLAYNSFLNGKISEMEQILSGFSADSFSHLDDSLSFQVLSCHILFHKGFYDQCLQCANTLLSSCQNHSNSLPLLNLFFIFIELFEQTSRISDSYRFIDKCDKLLHSSSNLDTTEFTQKEGWLQFFRGRLAWWQGSFDSALSFFESSLSFSQQIHNDHDIGVSLQNIGLIKFQQSDFSSGIQLHEQALQIFKSLDNKYRIAWCLQNLAVAYSDQGRFEQALSYNFESLKLRQEIGHINQIAWSYSNIGETYTDLGNFSLALEYFHKCLSLKDQISSKILIINVNLATASIYRQQGYLDKSFSYLNDAKDLYDPSISKTFLIGILYQFAMTYWMKSDTSTTINNFEEILSLASESDSILPILTRSSIYFWMIMISLEIKNVDHSNKYLLLLKDLLASTIDSLLIPKIRQNLSLAEALILKTSSRMRDKVQAQDLFNNIVNDTSYMSSYRELAMINLCELLLDELRLFGDPSVLDEVQSLLTKMFSLAESRDSFSLMTNALLLQSKLALLNGNVFRCEELLEQAYLITADKDLLMLHKKVASEKQHLQDQYESWKNLVDSHSSFGDRLEQVQLTNYLQEAKKFITIGKLD